MKTGFYPWFSACFGLFQFVSVSFRLTVSIQKRNNQNKHFVLYISETSFGSISVVFDKGVGPRTTLALRGWKGQPDIAVKVDRHDLKQAGSKKVL
jgi:hypothetical protein